eukprot:1054919-Prymnesium_polylepis.2
MQASGIKDSERSGCTRGLLQRRAGPSGEPRLEPLPRRQAAVTVVGHVHDSARVRHGIQIEHRPEAWALALQVPAPLCSPAPAPYQTVTCPSFGHCLHLDACTRHAEVCSRQSVKPFIALEGEQQGEARCRSACRRPHDTRPWRSGPAPGDGGSAALARGGGTCAAGRPWVQSDRKVTAHTRRQRDARTPRGRLSSHCPSSLQSPVRGAHLEKPTRTPDQSGRHEQDACMRDGHRDWTDAHRTRARTNQRKSP